MMRLTGHTDPRTEAQELMWDALGMVCADPTKAEQLCRKALELYPDCTDALTMLAELECALVYD